MVRRTKEEAQETRSQILDAAEQAFYERGVARTTLADIAALAGVTRGAIYWHFSNKSDLLQALLETLHEPLDELDEVDPLGCMRKLLIHLFHQVVLDPKTRRINEILIHKCEFTDEMCDMRRQRQTHSLECNLRISLTLRNAVHRGQLPENLDTTRAAVCIHAYINGLLGQWLLVPDSFELHQEAERWVDAGLDMLRLSPSLRN
jgi:TetR/AcrR family acrAB operon transcriptional repressor